MCHQLSGRSVSNINQLITGSQYVNLHLYYHSYRNLSDFIINHLNKFSAPFITPENISEFKRVGAVAFGIGTSLVDVKHKITDEYLNGVTENANKFVQAISL